MPTRKHSSAAHDPFGRYTRQAPQPRLCEVPGCTQPGEFRAPRDRSLTDYMWLCLDHVRDYNRAWDFFQGMSEAEIEAQRRGDTCWQRPSWKLGTLGGAPLRSGRGGAGGHGGGGPRVHDPFGFGVFEEDRHDPPRPLSEEDRAMQTLDLHPPLSLETLKSRYKHLVKQHHPDKNRGDKAAEERFKDISAAYRTLLNLLTA